MRILSITQWFDPEPAPIPGSPLTAALVGMGHTVEVVTGYPNYPSGRVYPGYRIKGVTEEVIAGARVVRVPLWPSHDRNPWRRAGNYVSFALSAAIAGLRRVTPPDCIYAYQGPATIALPAARAARRFGAPMLLHVQDLWPDSVHQSGMAPRWGLADRSLERWCQWMYGQAGVIVAQNQSMAEVLRQRVHDGVDVEVVYNWADESRFFPSAPDPQLVRWLRGDGDRVILYAGALGVFQGLDQVVEAAALVVNEARGLRIALVGSGTEEDSLKERVRERGAQNVAFLGSVPYEVANRLTASADALLISLSGDEFLRATVPSKTQVALACGKPVVMVAGGEARRIVSDAGAGLVRAPGDIEGIANAFLEVAKMSEADLREMGSAGRSYYERTMSLEVGTARLESLMRRLVGQVV